MNPGAERWSIQVDQLPVMKRLDALAQVLALLLERNLREETQVLDWKGRISVWSEYPARVFEPELLGLADLQVARILPARPERFQKRAYIQDSPMIPALEMRGNADYGGALVRHFQAIQTGFLLLEWDIAISTADYVQMAAYVYSDPEAVWAAPYFLYYPHQELVTPSQVPDWENADPDGTVPFVPFGCTYLPAWLLRHLEAAGGAGIAYPTPDHQFNLWADQYGARRRIAYYVRPCHLHHGHHVSMIPGGSAEPE